jgi:hypothetical protein
MIDREGGAIDGQASMTILSSASIAAPMGKINDFPDDLALVASPVSPTLVL